MRKQIYQCCMIIAVVLFSAIPLQARPESPPYMCYTRWSLAEIYSETDVALLVKWVDAKPPATKVVNRVIKVKIESAGQTTFEIIQIGKQDAKKYHFKTHQQVTIKGYSRAKKGDLFLLGDDGETSIECYSSTTVAAFNYMIQVPAPDLQPEKRLPYFIKYLEHQDSLIAEDAFYEFSNSYLKEITQIAKHLPRQKLRKWLMDKKTQPERLSSYGQMLGMCGTKEDALLLEKIIMQPLGKEKFRMGLDGIIGGYLLLTGTKGLALIEKEFFMKKRHSFSEIYGGMEALKFVWADGNEKISKDRLRQSMRMLMDRPAIVDLVICDLARWKDWSLQKRLMKMYDMKEPEVKYISKKREVHFPELTILFHSIACLLNSDTKELAKFEEYQEEVDDHVDMRSIKYAIIRYFLMCSIDVPKDSKLPEPAHVTKAKANLKILEEKDPKMVKSAKRFFFIK